MFDTTSQQILGPPENQISENVAMDGKLGWGGVGKNATTKERCADSSAVLVSMGVSND